MIWPTGHDQTLQLNFIFAASFPPHLHSVPLCQCTATCVPTEAMWPKTRPRMLNLTKKMKSPRLLLTVVKKRVSEGALLSLSSGTACCRAEYSNFLSASITWPLQMFFSRLCQPVLSCMRGEGLFHTSAVAIFTPIAHPAHRLSRGTHSWPCCCPASGFAKSCEPDLKW